MIKTSWVVMTVNSPAPKMGPVTKKELSELSRWRRGDIMDGRLWKSLTASVTQNPPMVYLLVRALRAGVPLEKLL